MQADAYPTRTNAAAAPVPRRDPVLWSGGAPPDFLTGAEVARFERDGLLVLRDLLDRRALDTCREDVARLRSRADELEPETVIREPGSEAIRSIFRVHRQSSVFAELSRHPKLVALAEYVLGGPVYIMQSRLNDKPGFDGERFDWHSDFETWHAEDGMPRMRALSVSIFLSDNTALKGPTMFIPGSHHTFVPCPGETPEGHYRKSLRRQQVGVPDKDHIAALAAAGGIVAPSGPAGTAVVFDCNLLHASAPNMTPWPRSNVFFVFNAAANALQAPFDGKTPRPGFLAERNAA